MLIVAAWYDLFQDGSIRNYVGIRHGGGTEAARSGVRMVIIPGAMPDSTARWARSTLARIRSWTSTASNTGGTTTS